MLTVGFPEDARVFARRSTTSCAGIAEGISGMLHNWIG